MNQDKALQDILETVHFLQENMVSEKQMDQRFLVMERQMDKKFGAVSEEIQEAKNEVMNHMDGFIVLHQKLDTELAALRSKYDRLESYILQLAKHAQFDLR